MYIYRPRFQILYDDHVGSCWRNEKKAKRKWWSTLLWVSTPRGPDPCLVSPPGVHTSAPPAAPTVWRSARVTYTPVTPYITWSGVSVYLYHEWHANPRMTRLMTSPEHLLRWRCVFKLADLSSHGRAPAHGVSGTLDQRPVPKSNPANLLAKYSILFCDCTR